MSDLVQESEEDGVKRQIIQASEDFNKNPADWGAINTLAILFKDPLKLPEKEGD